MAAMVLTGAPALAKIPVPTQNALSDVEPRAHSFQAQWAASREANRQKTYPAIPADLFEVL